MTLSRPIYMLLLLTSLLAGCKKKEENAAPPPPPPPPAPIVDLNWQFESIPVWVDDFSSGTSADAGKWSFETGGGGWGNHELEYYTAGTNSVVSGDELTIQAKKENFGGNNYTSSRMITLGKGDWLYGRFEVRAKLPKGRGTWPAIWMLPSDNAYGTWPASGEIDIMEHVGYDPEVVHWTVHTAAYNHILNTQKSSSQTVVGATDDFHIYRVDWTPYAVRFFLDGSKVFEFVNQNTGYTTWPFNKKFFMLLNIAVGGDWGGLQGVDDSAFPASMVVDYVKVYKMIE